MRIMLKNAVFPIKFEFIAKSCSSYVGAVILNTVVTTANMATILSPIRSIDFGNQATHEFVLVKTVCLPFVLLANNVVQ